MADEGAAGQQMRNKLNQKSENSVKEYITSSKKTQSTNTAYLAGFDKIEPDKKKPKVEISNEIRDEPKNDMQSNVQAL